MIQKVIFIGAGNVATHMARAFQSAGLEIVQVYSRSVASAKALGEILTCPYTNDKDKVLSDADLYVCSVNDDAITQSLQHITTNQALIVHTAGSVDISILEDFSDNFGVFYPLQTFTKEKDVRWNQIPIYVEANSTVNATNLVELGHKISQNVKLVNSASRMKLHLAAVFSCNFCNHLCAIADELLEKEGLPFSDLLPLISETSKKLETVKPIIAQTGPASRFDHETMNKQRKMLNDHQLSIYDLLSASIQDKTI